MFLVPTRLAFRISPRTLLKDFPVSPVISPADCRFQIRARNQLHVKHHLYDLSKFMKPFDPIKYNSPIVWG